MYQLVIDFLTEKKTKNPHPKLDTDNKRKSKLTNHVYTIVITSLMQNRQHPLLKITLANIYGKPLLHQQQTHHYLIEANLFCHLL